MPSIAVVSSFALSALVIIFGAVSYCTPGWVNETVDRRLSFRSTVVTAEFQIGMVVVTESITTPPFQSSFTTAEIFTLLPPAIQAAKILFPLGWAFAIAALVRFGLAQKLLNNGSSEHLIKKSHNQAVGFHIFAGLLFFLSLVIFTAISVPVMSQANSGQRPPGVNTYYFISSGPNTRPFTTGLSAPNRRPSTSAVAWATSFGYSFYLGWVTLGLQLVAIVLSLILCKKSSSASSGASGAHELQKY